MNPLDHSNTADAQLAPQPSGALAGEYLSFRLGNVEYGFELLKVQEIRSYEQSTPIAGAPECVAGVLNLRGAIVPVADLRVRFGLEPGFGSETVTVVVSINGQTIGLVADSVSDVVVLSASDIKPSPRFSGSIQADLVTGIGCIKHGELQRVLILLDVERLITESGIAPERLSVH